MRCDDRNAREAASPFLGEETVIDELQIDRAPHESERAANEQPDEQVRPPPERGRGVVVRYVPSWSDDLDLLGRRHRHVQLGAGDALDKRMRGPRALLELQLSPLDLEVVALRPLSLSSWTNSSRARCLQ